MNYQLRMARKISGLLLVAALLLPAAFSLARAQSIPEEPYRQQMRELIGELRDAKTDDARKSVFARIQQAREEYRASHPVKELSPVEQAAQRQKLEGVLKKAPFQWEMYQLRRSMVNAKTPGERDSLRVRIQALREKRAAEAEAKMTPEQRAARQARQERNQRMQAELKPFMERSRSAKTPEERSAIRAQMREIFEKYR